MSTPGDESSESITAAAKALAKATSRLAKAMGTQASEFVPDIQAGVSDSLRQASETLNRAAERAATAKPAQSKAARTREELLLAAAQVFAEQGIERASMGDIAAKAGYTKGALYANFASKQDLIREVARSTDRTSAASAKSELFDDTDCTTAIPGISEGKIDEALLADWLRAAQEDTRILLALELMAYGIRHPELRQEFADTLLTSFDAIAAQVQRFRLSRAGEQPTANLPSPDEGDVDTTVAILSIANHTALLNRLSESDALSPEAVARIIARIIESNDRG